MSSISEQIDEFIQADIDGQLETEQRQRLQQQMEQDPQLRQRYQDYRHLLETIDTLPALDPPPGIAESVLDKAVAAAIVEKKVEEKVEAMTFESGTSTPGTARPGKVTPRSPLFNIWFEFPAVRYALAFVIGAIFASGIQQVDEPGETGFESVNLAGTMSTSRGFREFRSLTIELDSISGQLDLLRADQILQLRFQLSTQQSLQVLVAFEDEVFQLAGFSQQSIDGPALRAGAGHFAIAANGEQRFTLMLSNGSNADSVVAVSFHRGNEKIKELVIPVPANG